MKIDTSAPPDEFHRMRQGSRTWRIFFGPRPPRLQRMETWGLRLVLHGRRTCVTGGMAGSSPVS
jgi:hypothetical protein